MTDHTDKQFESELQLLRQRLLLLTGQVEQMIAQSVTSLVNKDAELARQTIELDHKVNRDEIEMDRLCLSMLARWQPMASDLRFITLAMKMVTDLERIGDLAVNICERAVDLTYFPVMKKYEDIPKMATLVQVMIKDAIDAFIQQDVGKAQQVITGDDEVDRLFDKIFMELLDIMRKDEQTIEPAIHIQSVAKYIERMADHATNLAEQVIYMIQGQDVRHAGKLDEKA